MSTTIRADLTVRSVAIFELESRELVMEVMDRIMEGLEIF